MKTIERTMNILRLVSAPNDCSIDLKTRSGIGWFERVLLPSLFVGWVGLVGKGVGLEGYVKKR
jgi:hypothetical protein